MEKVLTVNAIRLVELFDSVVHGYLVMVLIIFSTVRKSYKNSYPSNDGVVAVVATPLDYDVKVIFEVANGLFRRSSVMVNLVFGGH